MKGLGDDVVWGMMGVGMMGVGMMGCGDDRVWDEDETSHFQVYNILSVPTF